jgi:hypothetical protein
MKARVPLHGQNGFTEVERGATVGATVGLNLYKADGTLFDLTSLVSSSGGSAKWGGITGNLSDQLDLQAALDAKMSSLILTTTGSSGAATLVGDTLNIPVYAGGGGGATNLTYTASPTNGIVTSDTGTDATVPLSTGTNAGLLAPAQHTKLAGIATGATANDTDANLKARANHTGTQAASTISDFTASVLSSMVTGKADRLANRRAGAPDYGVWTGTQAEYNALGSWDAGTDYVITDSPTMAEQIDDRVAALLVAGANVTLAYDDVANTLTIAATGGGGGGGNFVEGEIDFGAGASDATLAITGQTGITAGSKVSAWVFPKATTDHTADEHWLETISVHAGNIVAGIGFTIYAKNTNMLNEPVEPYNRGGKGGKGTLLSGKYTVQAMWG